MCTLWRCSSGIMLVGRSTNVTRSSRMTRLCATSDGTNSAVETCKTRKQEEN